MVSCSSILPCGVNERQFNGANIYTDSNVTNIHFRVKTAHWHHVGLMKCHIYLNDQHVDHAGVCDVLVFVKHLPHFVSALASRDVQLKQ